MSRRSPAAVLAAALWLAELTAWLGGHPLAILSLAALVLVPGLCAWCLLPEEADPVIRVAAVPIIGMAIASTLVIVAGVLGVSLTGGSVRGLLLVPIAVAVLVPRPRPVAAPLGGVRADVLAAAAVVLALGAVVSLAVFLQARVLAGDPVPGTDWGHYLLYGQEIARHHSLLIDNPFWMLGVPFREDPGAPALYGAYLLLSRQDAATLSHGIWLFAALGPVSVFVLVAGLGGRVAGLVGAAVYAVIPINQTILGWHGLANVYALQFVPIALLAAAMLLRGRRDWRWGAILAISLVAVLAAHRLTFGFTAAALAVTAAGSLLLGFRPKARNVAICAGVLAFAGLGVVADLLERGKGAGGLQDYQTYLRTKIDWQTTLRDITIPICAATVLAIVTIVGRRRLRRDISLPVLVGLLAATALLGYAWVLGVPSVYYRASYFLPLLIATAIGVAAGGAWLLAPRGWRPAAALLAVLVVLTAVRAYDNASNTRDFYAWSNAASLRGLDGLKRRLRANDIVVTDRCWSFFSPWLLQQPTLAALDDSDIQPAAELEGAATARWFLHGPRLAGLVAHVMGARYALVNPTCTDSIGKLVPPPRRGTPIFASERLVIIRLSGPREGPPRLTDPAIAVLLRGQPLQPLRRLTRLRV